MRSGATFFFLKLFVGLFLVMFFAAPLPAHAADFYTLTNGQAGAINEWGQCRLVTNNSGQSLFIPTKTSAEWASFYNNPPPSVTAVTCAGCTLDGQNIAHGGSITAYLSTRGCSQSCGTISQVRNCSGGNLDGSSIYSKVTCPAPSCASCTTQTKNWVTGSFTCSASASAGAHGTNRNVSDSAAPSVGSATFNCNNGTWAQTAGSCGGASCPLPWGGSINDGQSVTAWLASSVPCGSSCSSQTRTCNNGSLNGSVSYSNQSCSTTSCGCTTSGGVSIAEGQCTSLWNSTWGYTGSGAGTGGCTPTCGSGNVCCSGGNLSNTIYKYGSCSTDGILCCGGVPC